VTVDTYYDKKILCFILKGLRTKASRKRKKRLAKLSRQPVTQRPKFATTFQVNAMDITLSKLTIVVCEIPCTIYY